MTQPKIDSWDPWVLARHIARKHLAQMIREIEAAGIPVDVWKEIEIGNIAPKVATICVPARQPQVTPANLDI